MTHHHASHDTNYAAPDLNAPMRAAFTVGFVAAALLLIGLFAAPKQFFHSYLIGYIFWFNIALGSMVILMIQHLTGGAWGVMIRRLLEAAARTLPIVALLFIPILFGMKSLYSWMDPAVVAADPIIQQKTLYLNAPFFYLRLGIYFAAWLVLAYLLTRLSIEQDRSPGNAALSQKFSVISGPGAVIYGLTITFASTDWMMSIEAHWFSTLYGAMQAVAQLVSSLAFAILVSMLLLASPPFNRTFNKGHMHDLGKLLFAFLMVWAYMKLSQGLIIYSGNVAEFVSWYYYRTKGAWFYVAVGLVLLHFALPWILMLSRDLKKNRLFLGGMAAWILVMHYVDMYWMINPGLKKGVFAPHWLDPVALAAVGGIWLGFYLKRVQQLPLLPVNDPYLEEALAHHGRH